MFFRKREERASKEEFLRSLERQQAENTDRIARSVCAALARGNISLQQRKFITSKDLDDVQNVLADYFLKNRRAESA
jgi:hypothetical protein